MAHKILKFNGKSSGELGIVIQTTPAYNYPERDLTITHVPGRNGDVVHDNKSYKNVTREYSLAKWLGINYEGRFNPNAKEILNWLHSGHGKYVRLEDDYDPDVYRLATYSQGSTLENILDQAITFSVSFDCKPQRYLKSGEVELEFEQGPTASIENIYVFTAQPKIKIENLPEKTLGIDRITLMSTKNDKGEEVSLITLRNIEADETVYIDSYNFECYNQNNESITGKLNLNGKGFPVLEEGTTTIQITQYDQSNGTIRRYDDLIADSQEVIRSEYSPYDTTVAGLENAFLIPSYESIISSTESKYTADSYDGYVESECENDIGGIQNEQGEYIAQKYTITSPNEIIESYAQRFEISKSYNEMKDAICDWCQIEQIGTTDSYKLKLIKPGYVRNPLNSTRLEKRATNYYIINDSSSISVSSVTLCFWEIKTNESDVEYTDMEKDINSNLPHWIYMAMSTATESGTVYVNKFTYSVYDDSFIWKEKTNIFSKAKWAMYSADEELISYNWSTYKGRFTPSITIGGLLSMITGTSEESIIFKYCNPDDMPQYPTDEGEPQLFTISDAGTVDMTKITITTTKAGFYRYTPKGGVNPVWVYKDAEEELVSEATATNSFTVEYLKEVPTFSEINEFPVWLDDHPYDQNGDFQEDPTDPSIMNAESIYFKFKRTAWYRKYTENDEGELVPVRTGDGTWKGWKEMTVEGDPPLTDVDNFFKCLRIKQLKIGEIDKNPDPEQGEINIYKNDRYFEGETSEPSEDPPTWLSYELTMSVQLDKDAGEPIYYTCYRNNEDDDYPDIVPEDENDKKGYYYSWKCNTGTEEEPVWVYFLTRELWGPPEGSKIYKYDVDDKTHTIGLVHKQATIDYTVTSHGWYKLDSETLWRELNAGTKLRENGFGYQDTTIFYRMDSLPQYQDYDFNDSLEIEPITNIEGNPTEIKIKIKNGGAGYYRVNSISSWAKFEEGQELTTSITAAETNIFKLSEIDDSDLLDDVQISITPNWWTL